MIRQNRRRFAYSRRVASAGAFTALLLPLLPTAGAAAVAVASATPSRAVRCPWTTAAAATEMTPTQLAALVVSKMTTVEKVHFVDLAAGDGYENHNSGDARLCIPMLTLEDGPNGIAYNDRGVTQLPASLGVAASFDPALAYTYGQVIGSEARAQGVDVIQGPNLNLDRVPTSGRAFEAYGEDPYLTSEMGVADIEGIQSEGVMADAKHFTAYTQETDRLHLDQMIPTRALQELYLAPFRAAVTEAHVASVMCAYGMINGSYVCEDPTMFGILKKDWGFKGFVRSDLGAVGDPVAAFDAGLDVLKPAAVTTLLRAVEDHALPMARLNDAVRRILTPMFAYGVVEHPPTGHTNTAVSTPAAARVALQTTERSIVLLKNAHGVLPLSQDLGSIAVIGPDASAAAATAGFGSAYVLPPYVITPLGALRRWFGSTTSVSYAPGGPSLASRPSPLVLGNVSSLAVGHTLHGGLAPAATRGVSPLSPGYDAAELNATAESPGDGEGWLQATKVIAPTSSGLYSLSLTGSGDSFVYSGQSLLLADRGLHGRSSWSQILPLQAGRDVTLRLRWLARPGVVTPTLAMSPVSELIAHAVAVAKKSAVAVVFADDYSSEGVDRPTLELPGDQNALISAVAKVNHHTVVVLNTGGPVLMPWLSKVASVVEAWYPGQSDGSAIAAVLTGAVDPSGHLPVTFPRSTQDDPSLAAASWPGVAGRVEFGQGLALGYRYEDEANQTPLFAFGSGLSYTTFSLSDASVLPVGSGARATVTVTNTGARSGTAVVQGYITFPAAAGEPPRQLVTFGSATLAAGQSTTMNLSISPRAFLAYLNGGFTALAGLYTLHLGWSSRSLPISLSLTAPALGAEGGATPSASSGGVAPTIPGP